MAEIPCICELLFLRRRFKYTLFYSKKWCKYSGSLHFILCFWYTKTGHEMLAGSIRKRNHFAKLCL